MSDWFGEVHTLVVHSVTPPSGPFNDGAMEYEIEPSIRYTTSSATAAERTAQ